MKRIIDGKTYNTETATKVGVARIDDDGSGRNYYQGEHKTFVLYVTRGGAFFVHVHDEDADKDSFNVLTRDEAQKWMLEGEVELFDNDVFEEPPEAEAETLDEILGVTVYVRMPATLKRQIEVQAKGAGQSVNAYMIRCAEICVQHDPAT